MMGTVLVTGASSGFGRAIAMAFVARSDRVYAAARRRPEVPGATPIELDVTDESSRADALREIGDLDVLVNNAGVIAVAAWEECPDADLRGVFETNFFGPVALTRAVLPGMRARGGGRIVNVSAIGGLKATPFLGAYCAGKHALEGMTRSLDEEVRPFGIRAATVLPGPFRTSLLDEAGRNGADSPYAAAREGFRSGLATRLAAGGEDYSGVVEAVLSAATDPEPRHRYLVASGAVAASLGPVVEALEALS